MMLDARILTIGFTGTRNGMTPAQEAWVRLTLSIIRDTALPALNASMVGLHGACVGADADFDRICCELDIPTQCMPSTFDGLTAKTSATPLGEPKPPMQRNREIVAAATHMLACPPNNTPIKSGSGTWATIGFARRARKPLMIIFPDGAYERVAPDGSVERGQS